MSQTISPMRFIESLGRTQPLNSLQCSFYVGQEALACREHAGILNRATSLAIRRKVVGSFRWQERRKLKPTCVR